MAVWTPVDGPQAKSPGPNLLNSATRPNDGARWEQGFAWRPETCIDEQGFMPCDQTSMPTATGDNSIQWYEPPAYRVWDECTTLSTGALGLDTARLTRQADAVASFAIARELWTGELSAANPSEVDGAPHVNAHLASADAVTVTGTGTTAYENLLQLEAAAKAAAKGQQVVLHVPIALMPPLYLLRRVGDTLYTALDSIVVADAGYPGTGPAGTGTTWAYATGLVAVRVGALNVVDDMSVTLNRTNNRQRIWAERPFAAVFDPCVHLAMDLAAA